MFKNLVVHTTIMDKKWNSPLKQDEQTAVLYSNEESLLLIFIGRKNKLDNFMNLMNTWLPISFSQQSNTISATPTTIKTGWQA